MWLALLPLAAFPLFWHGQKVIAYSALDLLPKDLLSDVLAWLLRALSALAIIAIVVGLAGPFRPPQVIEKIGEGAQMIMLLDSSGSMDRPFLGENANRGRVAKWGTYTSKGQIARTMLSEYAAARKQDMFAFFVFSGNPIAVHPLTDKQEVIQAAITAGNIERGLATTNLAGGLIQSLDFFEDKPFTGSRIVMLVSDGAAKLTPWMQDEIKYALEKHRVTLYWIYLRDRHSPGLHTEMGEARAQDIAPEQLVHNFFSSTGLPYRAFPAEDPTALQQAIAEVDKLQNLPIRYQDIIPRRDLSPWCYGLAACLLGLLFVAKISEIQQWR
jgi:mxaC protein